MRVEPPRRGAGLLLCSAGVLFVRSSIARSNTLLKPGSCSWKIRALLAAARQRPNSLVGTGGGQQRPYTEPFGAITIHSQIYDQLRASGLRRRSDLHPCAASVCKFVCRLPETTRTATIGGGPKSIKAPVPSARAGDESLQGRRGRSQAS